MIKSANNAVSNCANLMPGTVVSRAQISFLLTGRRNQRRGLGCRCFVRGTLEVAHAMKGQNVFGSETLLVVAWLPLGGRSCIYQWVTLR